jgi:hypothetical protein
MSILASMDRFCSEPRGVHEARIQISDNSDNKFQKLLCAVQVKEEALKSSSVRPSMRL